MPNTITSYYTFVQNTKARASQVNTNFSNHRGHNVPIDPNTAAATDNTHDLGSSEHRWRSIYAGTSAQVDGTLATYGINFHASTTTGLGVKGDANGTGISLYSGGAETHRFSNTWQQCTSTAGKGQFGRSAGWANTNVSNASLDIVGSTLSIETYGRPIEISAFPQNTSTSIGLLELNAGGGSINLMRGGVTISTFTWSSAESTPLSALRFLDADLAAGTYVYHLRAKNVLSATVSIIYRGLLFAREL